MFLKVLKNSQENPAVESLYFLRGYQRVTLALMFFHEFCEIFENFYLVELLRTDRGFFLELFQKFLKTFKSTNE